MSTETQPNTDRKLVEVSPELIEQWLEAGDTVLIDGVPTGDVGGTPVFPALARLERSQSRVAVLPVAGDEATAPAPQWPLHPAAGLGLRLVYDETFVGRVDVGAGLDPVLEADGTVTQEPTLGFYLVFDHTF